MVMAARIARLFDCVLPAVFAWLLTAVCALEVDAQPRFEHEDRGPIDMGLVVIDGKVIPPPYTVATDADGRTMINGFVIEVHAEERFDRPNRRDADERGERRRLSRRTPRRMLERGLEQDMVLMAVTDAGFVSFHMSYLPDFVDIVTGDASDSDKLASLEGLSQGFARSGPWEQVLELGLVDPALSDKAESVRQELAVAKAEREAREAEFLKAEQAGKVYRVLLPVLSIGGVLIAIAVLIHTLRGSWSLPVEQRAWRHIDLTGARMRAVFQLAGVLVLLNGMDLVFTIIAQQTGEFSELNPLGERMIESPVVLGYYKTTLVAVGVTILLFLRHRRAAEVTAWWLCAVYMLVLVRWVAVNTVMVA